MDAPDHQGLIESYRQAAAQRYSNLPSLGLGGDQVALDDVHLMLRSSRAGQRSSRMAQDIPRSEMPPHGGLDNRESGDGLSLGSNPPVPLGEALKASRRMVLLGEAGAGKTTSLRFIALAFAQNAASARLGLDEARLPVYFSLRDRARVIAEQGLFAAVRAEVAATLHDADGVVDGWWREGRLALLLDGLDEVRDPRLRSAVVERIDGARLGANRVVVSARPAVYTGLGNLEPYRLCPVESREDRLAFFAGWIAALTGREAAASHREATALLDALSRRQGLARVMTSPLLMRMLAHIYVADHHHDVSGMEAAVRNRAEIYQHYLCRVLPAYLAETGRRAECPPGDLLATVRLIGYLLHSGQATTETQITAALKRHEGIALDVARRRLRDLQEVWGLLVHGPGSDAGIAFAHLTFQEYLCADWLAQRWCEEPGRTWRFLRPRLHLPAWREVILLLAGILSSGSGLLGGILGHRPSHRFIWRVMRAHSPWERWLHRDLVLAAHLLGEGPGEVSMSLLSVGWWVRMRLDWVMLSCRLPWR